MSLRRVNEVSSRLSLRPPQRASLEILDHVCESVPLGKSADPAAALALIRAEYPGVTDFEREFPSLCFSLATGVGKTRLMGAFIAYLHLDRGLSDFFVLAPNLTIYDKLIADFTAGIPASEAQASGSSASNRVGFWSLRRGFLAGAGGASAGPSAAAADGRLATCKL